MNLQLSVWLFLISCVIASYTDLRWHRVPNLLTYGTLAAIIAVSALHGFIPFAAAVGSAGIVLVIGSIVFGFGWIGGGDIKLLAVGAAAFGFPSFLIALLYISAVGGLIGLVYGLRDGRLRYAITRLAASAIGRSSLSSAAGSRGIPYALAICAGAWFCALSESFAPWLSFVR